MSAARRLDGANLPGVPMGLAAFAEARSKRQASYAPDWVVTEAHDRGPGAYYRFHIVGFNLNHPPGAYGHSISWSVPDLDCRFVLLEELAGLPAFDGKHWQVTTLAGERYAVETIR